ncbi:MAG: tetraacyldisaccharide 4'-kinase [Bdellovibrionales bacterium]|nr:tetraacyldisaccharide 4'-kinase [Bdellovibrionales bacterium]
MLMMPLGWLYSGAMRARNWFFDQKIVRIEKLPVPVVSVGNLTVGGTGKTPIVADLVQWSQQQQIPVGVISRGYKGKGNFDRALRVSSQVSDTVIGGDEPTMLARRFPQVPVYVHPDRVLAGRGLLAQHQVRWLIADDAFQHRRLKRDLNIVVFDASAPLDQLHPLPVGRARESLSALKRADFVVLTKTNLASPQLVKAWRTVVSDWMTPARLVECSYELEGWFLGGGPTNIQPASRVWLVSGIGNPQAFEDMIKASGVEVVGHSRFVDHHPYGGKDVEKIIQVFKNSQASHLITTSKDLTKLGAFPELAGILVEARLGLKWGSGRERLINELSRLVR